MDKGKQTKNVRKKGVKRQEISPGIIMEKYQEKGKSQTHYFIKIELQLFNQLDFKVDFTGSRNVELEGGDGLVKHTVIEPFTKVVVAKLLLQKNWNLKTKFKFSLQLPSIQTQRKHLTPILEKLDSEMERTKSLSNIDSESTGEQELSLLLKKKDWSFIDHDFPPKSISIGPSEQTIIEKYECIVHWRRAKYIVLSVEECKKTDAVPFVFNEGISPLDVKQGRLSDMWLLSAIAALAERPKLVRRTVLTKSANQHGLYNVKLCRMGGWQALTLDDLFPCFPLAEPIFSKNNQNEIWVMLLEKAFAKLFGGYLRLETGDVRKALVDLTGCPTFTYRLNSEETQPKIIDGSFFADLSYWNEQNYLITATTREVPPENSIAGLIREHAYCVLRTASADGTRLLQLRNPWGVFEWTGDWSNESPLWTTQLKNKIKPELDEANGTFWISLDHFAENFEVLNVCKTRAWQELRLKGKFILSIDDDDKKIKHFCSRWYYEVELEKPSVVIIGLHQEDDRYVGVKETRPNVDIGLSVLAFKDGLYRLVKHIDTEFVRECFLEIDLPAGVFLIVPRSVGVCLSFENENEKEVNLYAKNDPIMISVVKDIFQKYDLLSQGKLGKKEIKALFNFIEKDFNDKEFNSLIKEFGTNGSLTEKGLVRFFKEILSTNTKSYLVKIFENLGYGENLMAKRSRVFRLTLHSEELLSVRTKDALKDNIDFVANKLLVRKFGKPASENSTEEEVQALYYFNE